ncbi:MAG: ribonuclease P protein component [Bacteroidales bacterium]|jgi:ribonuclease P protein component|nr:ribonuclease P protein component [Bacteroidales bacterium]
MHNYSFSKQERIHFRNDFQKLFSEGKTFYLYPFKCVYLWQEATAFSGKLAVSVSKKKFRKAVDRNKIKRLIRESYRLEKHILYQEYAKSNQSINILIVYIGTKIYSFRVIEEQIIELINKIIKKNS